MTKSRSSSISLSRREALASVSAAAIAIGIGAPAVSAAAFDHAVTEPIDMTGHVPAYNASIAFGHPKTSATQIDDPYDLIFA